MFSKRCKNNLSWEWIITFWENVNWLWLNDWHYMYYIMNQLTLFVCWAFASSSSLTSSHKRNSRSSSRWTCSVLMLSVIAYRRGLFSEQCSHINWWQLAGPLVSICQLLVSPPILNQMDGVYLKAFAMASPMFDQQRTVKGIPRMA